MVLVPALRGLFGISVDGLNHRVTVDPHLPAEWPGATLHHVQVGSESVDIQFERRDGMMHVSLLPMSANSNVKLASTVTGAKVLESGREVDVPLPPVEVGLTYSANDALPVPGASTEAMKVLDEQSQPHQLTLTLEVQGGTTQELFLRSNNHALHITAEGATIRGSSLLIKFPKGDGYQQLTCTLHW
jgi:hypothetical protein